MVQPLWRTVGRFFKKKKMELLYDPAVPLLGIHISREVSAHRKRKKNQDCVYVFIHCVVQTVREENSKGLLELQTKIAK